LDKPVEEIIEVYKESIIISTSVDEKMKSIGVLLEYLTNRDHDKYKLIIRELKENLSQISPAANIV